MQFIPELAAIDFGRSAVIVFGFKLLHGYISSYFNIDLGIEKTKLLAMLLVIAGPVLM